MIGMSGYMAMRVVERLVSHSASIGHLLWCMGFEGKDLTDHMPEIIEALIAEKGGF